MLTPIAALCLTIDPVPRARRARRVWRVLHPLVKPRVRRMRRVRRVRRVLPVRRGWLRVENPAHPAHLAHSAHPAHLAHSALEMGAMEMDWLMRRARRRLIAFRLTTVPSPRAPHAPRPPRVPRLLVKPRVRRARWPVGTLHPPLPPRRNESPSSSLVRGLARAAILSAYSMKVVLRSTARC